MHRTSVLLAALALTVSGCGGAGTGGAGPRTPADHGDPGARSEVLAKALDEFQRTRSAAYESEVTVDGLSRATAHESGSYRLGPAAAAYERAILGIDQASSRPRVQVVRVRSTADGRWFLQLKEWGSWTGCWLRTDLPEITRLTGVAATAGSRLPTAVNVLLRARVVGSGGGLDGPHLAVDAFSALQFLGVSGAAIAGERAALTRVLVPVLLDVTADGSPSGAAVEGTQVVAALRSARMQVSSGLTAFAAKTHARVVFSDLGTPVRVAAPTGAELLPRDPSPSSTCPANR
jgi:hypothetical protein